MSLEVYIRGTVPIQPETSDDKVEEALRPWLEYIDEDSVANAKSIHPDEPGIRYDTERNVLEICWTGTVGHNFRKVLTQSLEQLNLLSDEAGCIDVTFYHDDGREEADIMFVGPDITTIQMAQKARMSADIGHLLGRQFGDSEIAEVVALVNQIFDRNWQSDNTQTDNAAMIFSEALSKQLH